MFCVFLMSPVSCFSIYAPPSHQQYVKQLQLKLWMEEEMEHETTPDKLMKKNHQR